MTDQIRVPTLWDEPQPHGVAKKSSYPSDHQNHGSTNQNLVITEANRKNARDTDNCESDPHKEPTPPEAMMKFWGFVI